MILLIWDKLHNLCSVKTTVTSVVDVIEFDLSGLGWKKTSIAQEE